jgi:ATP-dependent Clp protease protease subunit
MNKKFWNWVRNEDTGAAELIFNGPISEDTWFGDEITPAMFRNELAKVSGDLTVWLNSPGGDVFAASQIYTMLRNHKGKVTVKIDGIAASAASVVAMAGDETLIAPTGMLMIHNPSTVAFGNKEAMQKAIELLDEVKESIINAYELRTGLSRSRISHLMDSETWMNAKRAIELGFADGMLTDEKVMAEMPAFEFSDRAVEAALINKITAKTRKDTPVNKLEPETEPKELPQPEPAPKHGRSVDELMERLHLLNN